MDRRQTVKDSKGDNHPLGSKNMLVPRLLATLISLTVVGLGILALMTEHYYGRNNKYGGAEVVLDGGAAVAMGWGLIFLGLMPLALWFPSKRPALVWLVACVVAAGIWFGISIYGHRTPGHKPAPSANLVDPNAMFVPTAVAGLVMPIDKISGP